MPVSRSLNLSFASDFFGIDQKSEYLKQGIRNQLQHKPSARRFPVEDTVNLLVHYVYDDKVKMHSLNTTEVYWIQSDLKIDKFQTIGANTGKIVFHIPTDKIQEVWKKLIQAHNNFELGFCLRVETAKPREWPIPGYRMVTVHLADIFDVRKVGMTIWKINSYVKEFYQLEKMVVRSDLVREILSAYPDAPLTVELYKAVPDDSTIGEYITRFTQDHSNHTVNVKETANKYLNPTP